MKNIQSCFRYSLKKSIQATHLQKKYVHRTYDIIAEHFNHTRFAVWPKVKKFIDKIQEGSIIYDIGCGNGKYLNNDRHFMLGCDVSPILLEYTLKRNPKVGLLVSDVLNLPIRTQSCDAFICVAVLHHLSSKQTRIKALNELSRILSQKGKGLIYVWCLQQTIRHVEPIPKEQFEAGHSDQQDVLVRWHLQNKYYSEAAAKQFQFSQAKNAVIIKRYYHLYAKGELEALLQGISSLKIVDSYYDKENWCCEVQKV